MSEPVITERELAAAIDESGDDAELNVAATTLARRYFEGVGRGRVEVTDHGEPAFPQPDVGRGMTLRDYFAARAMQAITMVLANGIRPHDVPKLADDAYLIADAMLKARAK